MNDNHCMQDVDDFDLSFSVTWTPCYLQLGLYPRHTQGRCVVLLWIRVGDMHSSCILPASNEKKRVDKALKTKDTGKCKAMNFLKQPPGICE